jgi:hypothetical protein
MWLVIIVFSLIGPVPINERVKACRRARCRGGYLRFSF